MPENQLTTKEVIRKSVSAEEQLAIADHAGQLSKIIRDWLPVAGDAAEKTPNAEMAASYFNQAARYYEDCELIRNPDYVPFTGYGRGYSLGVHTDAFPYWRALLSTLDEIAVFYHWQGISDRSILHGWNWWGEDPIPSAEPTTLDRLDKIVAGLKFVATEIRRTEAKGIALAVPEVAATGVDTNVWKQARDLNSKITVSDQMATLFKNDNSIVDRKSLSKEVASILGCTAGAVRLAKPAWTIYRTEQARMKQIRQELKGKRWTDSEQNDSDD